MSATEQPVKRRLVNFEAPVEQIEHWKVLAHEQHMSFSAWIRMKLEASDDLPPIRYKAPAKLKRSQSEQIAHEMLERAVVAGDLARGTVKPSECINRVRAGTWCGKCGETHK